VRRHLFIALLFLIPPTGPAEGRQLALDRTAEGPGVPPMTTLAVSAGGDVLAGAPSGVYRSADGGRTWLAYDEGLSGLGRIVRAAFIDPEGTEWLGTEGGVYRRDASGGAWVSVGLRYERVNAITVAGRMVFAGTDHGLARSMDGGVTWTVHSIGPERPSVRTLAAHGSMVIAGTTDGVHLSHDAGRTWQPAGPGLEGAEVTVLFRAPTGTLFAATRHGRNDCSLFRSRSDGHLWSCANPDAITFRVEAMTGSAGGRLVVAGDRWVATSADEGHSWTLHEAGSSMVRAVAAVGHVLLAGTADTGILRSSSDGAGFVPSNDGLVEGWARVDLLALESMRTPPPPDASETTY
jgi:photosystem II stability/assembly factor-like uncharacterized protein